MMSVIDAEELAKRRKQKKTNEELTENYIYQEKIADLVEKILTDTAYILKRKDIELDHFLIELWVQSDFIALKFFQEKASLNKDINVGDILGRTDEFGDYDGLVVDEEENASLKLASNAVSKLQAVCLEGAVESIINWSGGK
jgi:hypothetical protein